MHMFFVVAPVLSYTNEVPTRRIKFFELYWPGQFHNLNLSYDLLFRRIVKLEFGLIDKLRALSKLFFLNNIHFQCPFISSIMVFIEGVALNCGFAIYMSLSE